MVISYIIQKRKQNQLKNLGAFESNIHKEYGRKESRNYTTKLKSHRLCLHKIQPDETLQEVKRKYQRKPTTTNEP